MLEVSRGLQIRNDVKRNFSVLKKHSICLYCASLEKEKSIFEIIYIIISMFGVTASTEYE